MDHAEHGLVFDLALCVGLAWVLGALACRLRQPVILGYLAAGVLLGPNVLGIVEGGGGLHAISEIGLALLLFLIGLEMDLKRVAAMGRVLPLAALAQIVGSAVLGVGACLAAGIALGGGRLDALYLGFGVALSSTVVVVKLLAERSELDTLPGRLTIGILIFQDLAAIIFVGLQPTLLNPGLAPVAVTFFRIALLVAAALLVSRMVLPAVFAAIARLPELVVVGSVAWCFALAATAERLGLSREMGALVAGVAISTYPYALDVEAKVASLRDLFVTVFFVLLGVALARPTWGMAGGALLLAALVAGTRALTVFLPLHLLRQGRRAAFLTSVNLAQVSEFSLVLLSLGVGLGHLDEAAAGPMFLAFILLAAASSYAIPGADALFARARPWLDRLGLRDHAEERRGQSAELGGSDLFVLGLFRDGSTFFEEAARHAPSLLERMTVIDFNPNTYDALRRRPVRTLYGDISQRDTLVHAGIAAAKVIVCPLTNAVLRGITAERLVRNLRALNPEAAIISVAETAADLAAQRAAGATFVLLPRLLAGAELLAAVQAAGQGLLDQKRAEQDARLAGRAEVVP